MSKSLLRIEHDRAVESVNEAALSVSFQEARIAAYTAHPALDADGGPMVLPLRFRIALNSARKRYRLALASELEAREAYSAAYPSRSLPVLITA